MQFLDGPALSPHTAGGDQLFHLQLPRDCCWSTAFPGRAVPELSGASSFLTLPSHVSLGMADDSGKACRRPGIFKPLIKDLAGQRGRVYPAMVGAVHIFWVQFITQS